VSLRCVTSGIGLARIREWLIQVLRQHYLRTKSLPTKQPFFLRSTTQYSVRLCFPASSSAPFQNFLQSDFQFDFQISKMSQFRQAGQKRRGDLSDAFPKVGRCLKCFKHLIVDPDAQCIQMPGLKNCERCSGNGGKCALVSSFKIPA